MNTDNGQPTDQVSRWRAFARFEQRLLAFLSGEVAETGQAFENSTEGALLLLTRLSEAARTAGNQDMQADIAHLVERLQNADRRRQELLQVTSVIDELLRQQAELVTETESEGQEGDSAPPNWSEWCRRQETAVTLTAWRKRLSAALNGQAPPEAAETDDSDVLF